MSSEKKEYVACDANENVLVCPFQPFHLMVNKSPLGRDELQTLKTNCGSWCAKFVPLSDNCEEVLINDDPKNAELRCGGSPNIVSIKAIESTEKGS